MASAEFWLDLVEKGLIEGDPTYYSDGLATPEEVDHAIEVAIAADRKEFVDSAFDAGIAEGDRSYWYLTPPEGDADLFTAIHRSVTTVKPGDGSSAAITKSTGFISGGVLTRIDRAGEDPLWGLTFRVQDIEHVYTFDSKEAMEKMLGSDAISSGKYGFMTMNFDDLNDGDTWLLGDAGMFAGQIGNYNTFFSDLMKEAALEAGVRNPGMLGAYLSDPAVQRIMVEGQTGNWSKARVEAEIRNTDFYLNTLYPGISNILQYNTVNPEGEYLNFMSNVTPALSALGYERDADGSYRSLTGDMLNRGISAEKFNAFAPTFIRAEQSQEFAETLNKWTQIDLGKSITFEDWFDVLDGSSSPDIEAVVEKATLSFAANATGTILDDSTISRLAELTQLSEQQMRLAFTSAEQALLSIGDANLARFGLSQQALVSAAFSIDSTGTDPLSTDGTSFTAAEIGKRARKAATELGLEDDRKANFFVGFDRTGRPVRTGLRASAPEVG